MIKIFAQFIFKDRLIPLVIYYWHLERLLTTFPIFHFYLFSNYIYYTLTLHLFLFIIINQTLKYYLVLYNRLNTKHDWILLYLCSFSFSFLLLIYILIIWVFLKCIIIPTILS